MDLVIESGDDNGLVEQHHPHRFVGEFAGVGDWMPEMVEGLVEALLPGLIEFVHQLGYVNIQTGCLLCHLVGSSPLY